MTVERTITPLKNIRGEHGLPVKTDLLKKQLDDYEKWKYIPSYIDSNTTINPGEFNNLLLNLGVQFRSIILDSNLSHSDPSIRITEQDVDIAHEIIDSIGPLERKIMPSDGKNPNRPTWNPSMVEHSRQVAVFARAIAQELKDNGIDVDENRVGVKGLFHDIGRAASHHPIVHALAGREILKVLGIGADFRTTTFSDNEAGVNPAFSTINPDNWNIKADKKGQRLGLDTMVANLPLEEVIVALADMGHAGIKQADGSFVNSISDPIDGLVPSALRRLTSNKGTPDPEVLKHLAAPLKKDRDNAKRQLKKLGLTEQDITKFAMYFGWCGALKRRVEKLGVKFEGSDGVVTKAQNEYDALLQERNALPKPTFGGESVRIDVDGQPVTLI